MNKQENFRYLQKVAILQMRVRNCEIEGMINPMFEQWLEHACWLGLITLAQLDELQVILNPDKP